MIKYWDLRRGDKVLLDDEIYEFIKIDGSYGNFSKDGEFIIMGLGISDLKKNKDGVYEVVD